MGEYEAGVAGIKRELLSLIAPGDRVVELGPGLGPNLPYLPAEVGLRGRARHPRPRERGR